MGERTAHARIESKHLPCDRWQLRTVHGHDAISRLFEFELLVAVGDERPDPTELPGAELTLVLLGDDGQEHRIHGAVTRVATTDEGTRGTTGLRLHMAPMAWMAELVETLDVFLDMSVPAVIERKLAMLDLAKGTDFELRLGDYPEREMITQYKETDRAFVSRLAEHLGICFFFEHGDDHSMLVFGDSTSSHRAIRGERVLYEGRGEKRHVYQVTRESRAIPALYVCRDYNYRTPAIELHAKHEIEQGLGGGVIEYGSHFKTPAEAEQMARVRAEERLCMRDVVRGESTCMQLRAGATVEIEGHPAIHEPLLLVEVTHHLEQGAALHSGGGSTGYHNSFLAIPASRTYRPPRMTPKPKIHGLCTGIVETRQSDIHKRALIDGDGRYRVRFLFDTAGPNERQASKRVRQIQPSAGPGYGMHLPLKPGVEVVLAFVEGDPDRPLIVGAVPNPATPSPVVDRSNTASRIRTESGILLEFEDGMGSRA